MVESVHTLAALKRQIASLDRGVADRAPVRMAIGHAEIDRVLGGGLAGGRTHELFGAIEEEGAAAGLALLFASHVAGLTAPVLWLRTAASGRAGGFAYGPGLAALGIDPERLLVGMMADETMLLRTAVDALRHQALGALLIELRGPAPLLDLTASRRLALAAEGSGVTAFLLRIGAEPGPSAADTRWRVTAAPSRPLPGQAPGMSAFALTLLRQRAGPGGKQWRLRWDSEKGVFGDAGDERDDDRAVGGTGRAERDAALSGAMVSVPPPRSAADRAA
ncbi:MAG: hypothetical protein ABW164_08675 [Sphingobium sp.]